MRQCTRSTAHGTLGEYSHCGYEIGGLQDTVFENLMDPSSDD